MKQTIITILLIINISCGDKVNDLEIQNCNSGQICYTENGIEKSFETNAEMHTDSVLVIGDGFDISINLHQLKVGKYNLSAGTLDEARAFRLTSDSLILDHFTTSYDNKTQGEIEITSYNVERRTISGKFEFTMTQFTGFEEKTIEITNGEFFDLQINNGTSINSAGTFTGKIEPSPFDSLAYYFISVLDFGDRLEFSMAHTTRNVFTIKFPKTLSTGQHSIQETNLSETDFFQIQLKTNIQDAPYYIPSINDPISLEIMEYSEASKILRLKLNGKIEKETGDIVNLKDFNIELHSW